MIRTSAITLAATCLLGACAPFTANWYQYAPPGEEKDAANREDVALVVANRGADTCVVHSVRLNAVDARSEAFQWPDPKDQAKLRPYTLRSGEMLVVPLHQLVWTGADAPRTAVCVLPLHIDVAASQCTLRAFEDFRIRFTPRLPNALPESWVDCPRPRPAAP